MALSETWFLDGYIDYELQKYRLLAYLKQVDNCFNEQKLYPQLADVIFHYRNLENFKNNKELLQSSFPKTLSEVDLDKLKLVYKEMLADNEVMHELERIIDYAIPQMKGTIESGTEIYELVEQQLRIEPVGILPLYKNEGYLMLHYSNESDVRVYNYNINLFTHKDARYKSLRINYVDSWTKNISITYENIKSNIIKTIKTLPNPAVYLMESALQIPINETLLPIAKRTLVRFIEEDAA